MKSSPFYINSAVFLSAPSSLSWVTVIALWGIKIVNAYI
jgi:hypothetical protein